jgi:hypothetical protein
VSKVIKKRSKRLQTVFCDFLRQPKQPISAQHAFQDLKKEAGQFFRVS